MIVLTKFSTTELWFLSDMSTSKIKKLCIKLRCIFLAVPVSVRSKELCDQGCFAIKGNSSSMYKC